MFSRQRSILKLIHNEGGTIERLRLVKLAFLLSKEKAAPRTGVYDFVPYKRGPFSFTLYHDLQVLQRDGWLSEGDREVSIVEAPHLQTAFLDAEFVSLIDSISSRYRSIETSAMVDSVYRAYPWFTLNSESLNKRAVSKPTASPAVYTVGYEGITVDALLNLLLSHGIERLIDVRCNPIARRYGFHKSTLLRLCSGLGIDYVHFASLGVPSAWREELSDQSSYERVFSRYEKEILPRQHGAIAKVVNLTTRSASALLCMEADHNYCHRSRLGAEVARQTSLPIRELREM